MKIFDNVTEIVRDDMAQTIKKGSKVWIPMLWVMMSIT